MGLDGHQHTSRRQDVILGLQRQMAKTGESFTVQVDADRIEVRVETLTHMMGLLDWATSFHSSQVSQQRTLILSTRPWRDDNLLTAAECFF